MKTNSIFLLILAISLLACSDSAENYQKLKLEKLKKRRTLQALASVDALPKKVKTPLDNPSSFAKITLGRLLFFDPILSGDKEVACATCHHPQNGYAEFRDLSIGVNGEGLSSKRTFKQPNDIPFLKRNSQTILNTAFNGIDLQNSYNAEKAGMFWDLRANSLEEQALEPIKTFEEMRGHHFSETEILKEVVERLNANPEYQKLFQAAFEDDQPINQENIAKAIATYERTIIANNSRFDQYMRGDEKALSLSEKDGFELFKKVGCANCHNGPMFSDYKVHVLGVPTNQKLTQMDKGFEETYAFRTASLRNLRFTAPYMHNGSLPTLKRVLEFYEDIAMGKERHPAIKRGQYDPLVHELKLRVKDMGPIISFLNSLNDENFDKTVPESVPSGLQVGGNID